MRILRTVGRWCKVSRNNVSNNELLLQFKGRFQDEISLSNAGQFIRGGGSIVTAVPRGSVSKHQLGVLGTKPTWFSPYQQKRRMSWWTRASHTAMRPPPSSTAAATAKPPSAPRHRDRQNPSPPPLFRLDRRPHRAGPRGT